MTSVDKNTAGVFDAVVTRDCYRLRSVVHPIHTVFDIGANVGMFSLAARVRFPEAHIIAVEPQVKNFEVLSNHTKLWPNTTCINAVLGTSSDVYYKMGHGPSHSHHTFVTPSKSFPLSALGRDYVLSDGMAQVTPATLAETYGLHDLLVKIDTEGAEDCLVDDAESNDILHRTRYVCMELHFYSPDKSLLASTKERLLSWVYSFEISHKVETEMSKNGGLVWMTRK